jgi:hypothetical protein
MKCGTSPLCWNLQYGCDACANGYVWRDAVPGDHVCVEPASRTRSAQENQGVTADVCPQGYVWREIVPTDHVCVLINVRDQVIPMENALGPSRTQVATGMLP